MQAVDRKLKLLAQLHFIHEYIVLFSSGRIMAFNVIIQSMIFL